MSFSCDQEFLAADFHEVLIEADAGVFQETVRIGLNGPGKRAHVQFSL